VPFTVVMRICVKTSDSVFEPVAVVNACTSLRANDPFTAQISALPF